MIYELDQYIITLFHLILPFSQAPLFYFFCRNTTFPYRKTPVNNIRDIPFKRDLDKKIFSVINTMSFRLLKVFYKKFFKLPQ